MNTNTVHYEHNTDTVQYNPPTHERCHRPFVFPHRESKIVRTPPLQPPLAVPAPAPSQFSKFMIVYVATHSHVWPYIGDIWAIYVKGVFPACRPARPHSRRHIWPVYDQCPYMAIYMTIH